MNQDGKSRFSRLREIPSAVWALGFVSLLMDTSSEIIHALLPVYLVNVLGASMVTVGFIEGVAEATASITKVFSGAISDWLGKRKWLAVIGYGLAALTKPIFPLAPSVGWLVAARFIDRIGKGIRGAPRDALIADITPAHLRGASFGLRQSLDTVGAFLGPALAIGLMWLTANNFRAVFWVAVIPGFLCVALLVFAIDEPERPAGLRKVRSPLSVAELKRLGLAYWFVVGIAVVFSLARFSEAFLILRAQAVGLPVMLVPLVLVLMNLVYSLAAYPAGVLSDRVNRITLLSVGFGFLVAADLALAFTERYRRRCRGRRPVGIAHGVHAGAARHARGGHRPAGIARHGLWHVQPAQRTFASGRQRARGRIVGAHRTAGHLPRRRGVDDACVRRSCGGPPDRARSRRRRQVDYQV